MSQKTNDLISLGYISYTLLSVCPAACKDKDNIGSQEGITISPIYSIVVKV